MQIQDTTHAKEKQLWYRTLRLLLQTSALRRAFSAFNMQRPHTFLLCIRPISRFSSLSFSFSSLSLEFSSLVICFCDVHNGFINLFLASYKTCENQILWLYKVFWIYLLLLQLLEHRLYIWTVCNFQRKCARETLWTSPIAYHLYCHEKYSASYLPLVYPE